jgi:RNA polymerase sigma-70 factor (ECF subfamily)
MPSARLDHALVRRLHGLARADRWDVSVERFGDALAACAAHGFPEGPAAPRQLERYLAGLRLEDVALACACADGHEGAWEHFVREHRPPLYRAADAIDPTGSARELADSLYADLYGLAPGGGQRRSLFGYFHGRSSLSTWLRAVLAQRHVDRIRSRQRLAPLPDEDAADALPARSDPPAPERPRFLGAMERVVTAAIARLAPRDRLRLACYYAQGLTLAQIGRALGEHEATVSRQLARSRRAVRDDVEDQLRHEGMTEREVQECFASVVEDAGTLDLRDLLGTTDRKNLQPDRSR